MGSGTRYLVDTGAAVSVFPGSQADTTELPSTSTLAAANGTPIETFGHRSIKLTVGRFTTEWPFLLARVTKPILWADFLHHSGFLVDVKHKRLVQADTWDMAPLQPAVGAHQVLHLQAPEDEYLGWIKASYPELLVPRFSEPTAKHGVVLQIPTTWVGQCFPQARLLPIRTSSPRPGLLLRIWPGQAWSADPKTVGPRHCTWCPREKGGGHTATSAASTDATGEDKYLVPHLQDFSAQLNGCRVFSKVHLIRGYHQIPVVVEDVHKTAVIMPFRTLRVPADPVQPQKRHPGFQAANGHSVPGPGFCFHLPG